MKLTEFGVLTFDCYGTLIDWESGITEGLQFLVDRASLELSRDDVLEAHARHESALQSERPTLPYADLLAEVCKGLADEWGCDVESCECSAYGRSVGNWPAFSDSVESLKYLKEFYKLVILSNVDNVSFAQSNKRLGVAFDAVYTAADIGSYKPAMRNFQFMIEDLGHKGISRDDILHVAESLFHDHGPANRVGLKSCRIYRRVAQGGFGATMVPESPVTYDFCFNSMAAFVDHHRQEMRSG